MYSQRGNASSLQLTGVAMLCAAVGFFGARAFEAQQTQLRIQPVVRNVLAGTAIASAAIGTGAPAIALEPAAAPVVQAAALSQPTNRFAEYVAPGLVAVTAEEPVDNTEIIQIVIGALLIPVLGYAAWQFGTSKALEDAELRKSKFEKDLEQGNLMKVSPSGIPTVRGLPMASDGGWKIQCDELKARGIKGLKASEAIEQVKNLTVIDVRSRERYQDAAVPGSINIPLFQPITGWSPFKIARRLQFAVFGVSGTEYNPDFMAELEAKVKPLTGDVLFLDDSVRGTLEPTIAFPDGKPGHALMAIYLAATSGFPQKMTYVEGGVIEYGNAGGELVAVEK